MDFCTTYVDNYAVLCFTAGSIVIMVAAMFFVKAFARKIYEQFAFPVGIGFWLCVLFIWTSAVYRDCGRLW